MHRERHPIAGGGQIDVALQADDRRGSALQRRCGHPRHEPHELAVVDRGVGEDLNRAILTIEPQSSTLDDD